MKPQDAYKFCPQCGSGLSKRDDHTLICSLNNHLLYIDPIPSTGTIITNEANEILLVKRRVNPKKDFWDVPGGFVELGESLEEGLRREVKEELGVEIEINDFIGGFNHEEYGLGGVNYPVLGSFFTAKIKEGIPTPADDVSEVRFFKSNEIPFDTIAFPDVHQALKKYLQNLPS